MLKKINKKLTVKILAYLDKINFNLCRFIKPIIYIEE